MNSTIRLPVPARMTVERLHMGENDTSLVYFVDDEPSVCKTVERTIIQLGHQVKSFTSGRDCLAKLKHHPCDLLITDVQMKDMDGIRLLTEAKKMMPWLPVLVVTGYADIPLAVEALQLGAANFIEKPLEREAFIAAITKLLDEGTRTKGDQLGKDLTRTEKKILYLVLEGMSSREIADLYHRSLRTVELHRHHVMQKLGVDNVVGLVRRAMEMGFVRSDIRTEDA